MALKEHGDRIAEKPFYRFITVSLNPPGFKWIVSLRGLKEYGEAGNKRDAKHIASMKIPSEAQQMVNICETLGTTRTVLSESKRIAAQLDADDRCTYLTHVFILESL
ncbi:uncharacterized protein M437DRAFT_70454 [Aureobasidium melanogenum CBS 110374]|uniref:Uncharacterized protein n=1 Tax=Aureobasidium melanogenum (strain CBS 110374) TaxID=1043003 RepID=A0A074VJT6_AURM1|nr:uncharacterized protein M437DRAFT_70454 [Aureobasidium melanogenum CBS 110374]KEQ57887.1 hypothetical protein M437DRAFT_70454 [Aureobasidium melanogenum CBS 110374]